MLIEEILLIKKRTKKLILCKQCQKIGEVSYMIEWYRLPGKNSLALVLIIAMSRSSIKFTAGNYFELSLCTFGDVSNTHSVNAYVLNLTNNIYLIYI